MSSRCRPTGCASSTPSTAPARRRCGSGAERVPGGERRGGPKTRLRDREGFLAWAFLLPSIVYLTALVVAPFGLTVAFAFSRSTSEAPSYRFAGLRDFRAIFGDHVFWRSLGDTLGLTAVSVVLVVALGTTLAHVLLAEFRFRLLL